MTSIANDPFVARAAAFDSATLSDALDRCSVPGQCYKIAPCDGKFRMAGRAFTILYRPSTGIDDGDVGEYIDDVEPGSVIVIDNRGRDTMGTWGNILTEAAHARGMAGTVIDGINRDVALCRELGYPIFSRGHWMRTGKGRIVMQATQVPVQIGGAVVHPGDIVRGDADGVVVIPRSIEGQVLDIADEIAQHENAVREKIRAGMRLDVARSQHHYHHLQSPDFDGKK
jgi:4-hydroxy-4-methyl-2-oxoglutarate aldolase